MVNVPTTFVENQQILLLSHFGGRQNWHPNGCVLENGAALLPIRGHIVNLGFPLIWPKVPTGTLELHTLPLRFRLYDGCTWESNTNIRNSSQQQ